MPHLWARYQFAFSHHISCGWDVSELFWVQLRYVVGCFQLDMLWLFDHGYTGAEFGEEHLKRDNHVLLKHVMWRAVSFSLVTRICLASKEYCPVFSNWKSLLCVDHGECEVHTVLIRNIRVTWKFVRNIEFWLLNTIYWTPNKTQTTQSNSEGFLIQHVSDFRLMSGKLFEDQLL